MDSETAGKGPDGLINYASELLRINALNQLKKPLVLVYPKEGVITARPESCQWHSLATARTAPPSLGRARRMKRWMIHSSVTCISPILVDVPPRGRLRGQAAGSDERESS